MRTAASPAHSQRILIDATNDCVAQGHAGGDRRWCKNDLSYSHKSSWRCRDGHNQLSPLCKFIEWLNAFSLPQSLIASQELTFWTNTLSRVIPSVAAAFRAGITNETSGSIVQHTSEPTPPVGSQHVAAQGSDWQIGFQFGLPAADTDFTRLEQLECWHQIKGLDLSFIEGAFIIISVMIFNHWPRSNLFRKWITLFLSTKSEIFHAECATIGGYELY